MSQNLTTLKSASIEPVLTLLGNVPGILITSITAPIPGAALLVAGGETVTVTGTGFSSGIVAYIDSVATTTTFVSSTSATFVTPATSVGTYNLTLHNTNGSSGILPGSVIFDTPPSWVTSAGALMAATIGVSYSTTVSATGTGISYSVTSGSLPTGLSLNGSTGAITGTPSGSAGTINFTITATNSSSQPVARAFSIQAVAAFDASYLVVAGGGSGGTGYYGGGGGAGGLLESSASLSFGVQYTITVGTGGVGTTVQTNRGGNGGNSSISGTGLTTITAIGGGGGGSRNNDSNSAGAQGAPGGSGGGASYVENAGGKGVYPGSTYLSQSRQGYDGGSSASDATFSAGGGGAGGAGQGAGGSPPRAGGSGLASSITGTSVYYAGGGGNAYGASYAGQGGGGVANDAGSPNTGGGGGGGTSNNGQGGNGGSGVIIIKYSDTYPAATTTGSPTVTSITGYRVYKFTGSGTFNVSA